MSRLIYLDHAASTPVRPAVAEAMAPYLADVHANPSGVHAESRKAKNALEEARERVAAAIGAAPNEVVFTSGGTESDNLAVKGAALAGSAGGGVVTTATEHEAVLESAEFLGRLGKQVTIIPVGEDGRPRVEDVMEAVEPGTDVVSVMVANNQTGALAEVSAIAAAVKAEHPGVAVHTDAIQAFSSEDVDVEALGVDLLSLTAHKFGGPRGAGLLYVREGTRLEPLSHGGGQEMGRRSGTHDVAAAVGLAEAMELAVADRSRFKTETKRARDGLLSTLEVEGLEVNTPLEGSTPQHLNVRIPGVRNESLLIRMDRAGIAASGGSACQSGAARSSHVLEAMGATEQEARESVRFSFGWDSTLSEARQAGSIVSELVRELR